MIKTTLQIVNKFALEGHTDMSEEWIPVEEVKEAIYVIFPNECCLHIDDCKICEQNKINRTYFFKKLNIKEEKQ